MENSKTKVKDNNATGEFLGKLAIPYMLVASTVGLISFVRHWEETNFFINLVLSSVAGFFWPITMLFALFS